MGGCKPRMPRMRVGAIGLPVARACDGFFSTDLFARYRRNGKALVAAVEAHVPGVPARKAAKVAEALCGTRLSASTVPRLREGLDCGVGEWESRPPDEAGHP